MDYYRLGRVLKPVGLEGGIKLAPFVDDLDRFRDLTHIYLKTGNGFERRDVRESRTYRSFAYIKISGCSSVEEAEKLRNSFVYIDRQSAVKPEGTHFIADLIGMSVRGTDGTGYRELSEVLQHGSADVYCVKGAKDFMFPALKSVITGIDEDARVITVDPERLKEVAVYD